MVKVMKEAAERTCGITRVIVLMVVMMELSAWHAHLYTQKQAHAKKLVRDGHIRCVQLVQHSHPAAERITILKLAHNYVFSHV
jgi:hypothetical protein